MTKTRNPWVVSDLPTSTVTFLFTDIEGSTKLLHELGTNRYSEALAEHRRRLREAFARYGGVEVDTQGDAFFYAFPTAPGALAAAAEGREALASGPIRVRIGLHTGTAHPSEEGYVGQDVHRAARIASAAHGGQVVVSAATAALVVGVGFGKLKRSSAAVPSTISVSLPPLGPEPKPEPTTTKLPIPWNCTGVKSNPPAPVWNPVIVPDPGFGPGVHSCTSSPVVPFVCSVSASGDWPTM